MYQTQNVISLVFLPIFTIQFEEKGKYMLAIELRSENIKDQ